ncbi:type II secretion system protein N [Pusillimonas sp. MFBS29]|uniref:type II secretion system protein N n=1 Tax=Pusillimonas sp. MFBS29 TaxID=2886690 RepID=UPI001D10D6DE|nr:type II secretion system protein N [Pusillimonas sp. MFBS29]MCC2595590.1 type II secretion system protein N [Pusillimonas sp. MFBS29]
MSTGRLGLLIAALAALACAAALLVLPARWLMAVVPGHWPLTVVDASGTIWSGSATVALGTKEHQRTVSAPLRWETSWSRGPKLTVHHPWLGGPLALTPAWLGLGVSGQTLQLPAAALATLDARIAAVDPGGTLSIKWPASVIGRAHRPDGTTLLEAHWRDAASALTPISPLGDYALVLKQKGPDNVNVTLSTREGVLRLDGHGVLNRKQGFQFDGTAQADPSASANDQVALRDVLAALGPQRNNQTLLRFR